MSTNSANPEKPLPPPTIGAISASSMYICRASSAQEHPGRRGIRDSPPGCESTTVLSVWGAFYDPKPARSSSSKGLAVCCGPTLARPASIPCRSATAFCDPNPARLKRTKVASTLWDETAARSTSARGALACNGSNPAGLASTMSKAPNPFWARRPSVSQEDVTIRGDKYHSGCCVSSMADTAGGEGPTGIGIPVDVDAVVASPSMIPRSAPDEILDTLVRLRNPTARRAGSTF